MVRNGLIPGGFSTKTSRYAVFFTVVDPMDDEQQGLREKFFAIDQKQESRLAKILGNQFKTQYSGALYCPLEKEDCDFTKQGLMRSYSHCLQDSMRKRYAWKLKSSFTKEKAKDHVLCSKQIRGVNHKIYLVKKQDHLGKHKARCRASGRPDATWWTVESQACLSQQFKSRMNKGNIQSPSWSSSFESHKYKEQFLPDMSQTQKINRFSEASQKFLKDMTKQKSSGSSTTLKSFSALTASPFRSGDYFLQMRTKYEVQSKP